MKVAGAKTAEITPPRLCIKDSIEKSCQHDRPFNDACAPKQLPEDAFLRDGNTCGISDRAGHYNVLSG